MPDPARFSVEKFHFSCIRPAPSCAVPTNIVKALPRIDTQFIIRYADVTFNSCYTHADGQGRKKTTAVFQDDFIKKANLSDIVVQRIMTTIRKGELKPGERIPSHDELCERWGISRTTIREALNKLESMGILTKYQGRGTYINSITAQEVIPANQMGSLLDKTAVLQLLEARKLVEPLIASLSAQRRTHAELQTLQKRLDELEQANTTNDHELYSRADHEFHLFISKMSKNEFLEVMMRNISAPLAVQQMEVISLKPEEQDRISAESQSLHQRIFDAIRDGDPQAAKSSMELHLESVETFMKKNL